VPGLRDHVADHWQTLMAAEIPGSRTVAAPEHDKLSCAARLQALDMAIQAITGPIVLVAHSAGCVTVAHWALTGRRPIQAALLATPADIERPLPTGYPSLDALRASGWLPLPRWPLPFRTVLAASSDDPLATLPRSIQLASDWQAEIVTLGSVGHLNPASGYGPWPQGRVLVEALIRGQSVSVPSAKWTRE
jgi:predicted alpha/beta hydrolase family esterase